MRRPSPALVVATLALFFSVAGTGYAVTQLPRNSVGSAQLKKNAVTAVKIKKNAVTGAKVKDGSLTSSDFAAGTLLQGAKGDTGATGAPGATGPAGPSTSAAAWHIPTPFSLTSAFQDVISLGATPTTDNDSTGTITVSEASNLVITADLTFLQTDAMNVSDVGCVIEYRNVASGGWNSLDYGYVTHLYLDRGQGKTSITPIGLQPVAAGTYDVKVVCREYGGAGDAEFQFGTLTVTATGQ